MRYSLAALLLLVVRAGAAPRPEVVLDARVELAAALHLLAAPAATEAYRDDGSAYARLLLDGLEARAAHPAVAAYALSLRRPAPGSQSFMTPLRELVGCLREDLALDADAEECRRAGLPHAAADFAAATGFAARLPALAAAAETRLAALRLGRDEADLVALFEEYSGLSAGPHRVAPSPLLAPGRAWNALFRGKDGAYRVITVIAPAGAGKEPPFDWRPVMRDVWHEHGHAHLDPAVDAASAAVRAASGLAADAASGCYGDWTQCVREHLAQGLSLRVLEWARENGRVRNPADLAPNPHLPWQKEIAALLAANERKSAKKRRLDRAAPALLEFFVAEARRRGLPPRPESVPAPSGESEASRRGMELFAAGRHAEAAEAFAADAQAGGGAPALLNQSVALTAAGRARAAADALDRAILAARSDPRLPPEFLPDALSTRASAFERAKNAARARRDREEALILAPLDWPRRDETKRALGL